MACSITTLLVLDFFFLVDGVTPGVGLLGNVDLRIRASGLWFSDISRIQQ